MQFERDHYDVLGVSPKASLEEIRRAHRVRAVYDHRHGVLGVQGQLERLREAYEVLTDDVRRREFDRLRRDLLVVPRRIAVAEETRKRRREGRLRQAFARKMAADARRLSRACVATSATFLHALTSRPTSDAATLPQVSLPRVRALWMCVGLAAGMVLLYVLRG